PSNIGTFAWTSPNGAFEFTAAPGFAGTVDIPYTTCDNGVPSACANATIHIVVEAPVVITRPDVNSGLVNEPIPGDVSTNDDVPPGTTYGTPIGSVSNPNNNTPVMDPDGSYTFETDKPGIYEFEIPVCVPGAVIPCPTETLIITVTDPAATNNPPILVNDNSVTLINTAVTNNVLVNDRPGNTGGTLGTPSIIASPAHGTVTIGTGGNMTYTPVPNYVGTDRVEYRVCESPSGQC